jgi:hypothetical protein
MDDAQAQRAIQLVAATHGNLAHLLRLAQRHLRLLHHADPDRAWRYETLAALEQLHAEFILRRAMATLRVGWLTEQDSAARLKLPS